MYRTAVGLAPCNLQEKWKKKLQFEREKKREQEIDIRRKDMNN